jgi:hypothetical protein
MFLRSNKAALEIHFSKNKLICIQWKKTNSEIALAQSYQQKLSKVWHKNLISVMLKIFEIASLLKKL